MLRVARSRARGYSNLSRTPSTTLAVVDLSASQVFSPALRTEASGVRLAGPAAAPVVFFRRPVFPLALVEELFFVVDVLLRARFFPRLGDFLVGAM
jgi:hypothetical protein